MFDTFRLPRLAWVFLAVTLTLGVVASESNRSLDSAPAVHALEKINHI